MSNTNICSKCEKFIIGDYCHSCKCDANDYAKDSKQKDFMDFFKDIFGGEK